MATGITGFICSEIVVCTSRVAALLGGERRLTRQSSCRIGEGATQDHARVDNIRSSPNFLSHRADHDWRGASENSRRATHRDRLSCARSRVRHSPAPRFPRAPARRPRRRAQRLGR